MKRKIAVSVLATVAVMAAAGVSRAAAGAEVNRYCHYNGTLTCAGNFRELVKIASFGRVTDAPLTAPGGEQAARALVRRMEAANPYLSSVHFTNSDWSGGVLSIAANGCKGLQTHPVNMELHRIEPAFDNRVNSEVGANDCQVSLAADPGHTGYKGAARPYGWHNPGTELYNQTTSIRYYRTPTREEAAKACGSGAAVCTLNKDYRASLVSGTPEPVAFSTNCTSVMQNRALWWETSVANEVSFTTEYGQKLLLGLEFGDLKTGVEIAFSQTYGHSTTNTTTFKQQDTVSVPARHRSVLYKTPTYQVLTGSATVRMNDGGVLVDVPWTVKQAASDGSHGLTWDEIPLTASQLADPALCPVSGGVNRPL